MARKILTKVYRKQGRCEYRVIVGLLNISTCNESSLELRHIHVRVPLELEAPRALDDVHVV